MDNTALARFITSVGSLNDYASTPYQTKQALDRHTTSCLRQDNEDVAIFTDALKGLHAAQKIGFSADGIIAINRAFDSPSKEEPQMPGHLRNAHEDPEDKTAILLSANAKDTPYFPPDVVTKGDLTAIVQGFLHSEQRQLDAWRVFAKLAKLQPFQDGNKRTALIAANAAFDTLNSDDYLILPPNELDRAEFMITLMRFYKATDAAGEEAALTHMVALLPSPAQRQKLLLRPIHAASKRKLADMHVKREF